MVVRKAKSLTSRCSRTLGKELFAHLPRSVALETVQVHDDETRFAGGVAVTCSRSVDPSIARVEEVPPEITWPTSSKYSVPTKAWCSTARYPCSRAANSLSCNSAYADIPRSL